MTKEELIKKTGSEEQADFAMEIILKSLQPAFVQKAIFAEIDRLNREISEMEKEGYIYTNNGSKHVNWGKPQEDFTMRDEAYKKCQECNALLYKLNRTVDLIASR